MTRAETRPEAVPIDKKKEGGKINFMRNCAVFASEKRSFFFDGAGRAGF